MADTILSVRDLSTRFSIKEGQVNMVENVSFDVEDDEIFGIVGESDSDKSMTALSVIDLIGSLGRMTQGEMQYCNTDSVEEFRELKPDAIDGDLVDIRRFLEGVRRPLRGLSLSIVFQDPMGNFNPSITVDEQIIKVVEVQRHVRSDPCSTRSRTQGYSFGSFLVDLFLPSKSYVDDENMGHVVELLDQVGILDPKDRTEKRPHQFSGGMLQHAMIVQVLVGKLDVLIASESATALDVTIQAQILNLLRDLQKQEGVSILMITHDLGVIARICDHVNVIYAGEVVERGPLTDVFDDPIHPYIQGLLGSIPDMDDPSDRLEPIPDNMPSLLDSEILDACYFADGCPKTTTGCLTHTPEYELDGRYSIRCVLVEQEYDPADAVGSVDRNEVAGEVNVDD